MDKFNVPTNDIGQTPLDQCIDTFMLFAHEWEDADDMERELPDAISAVIDTWEEIHKASENGK